MSLTAAEKVYRYPWRQRWWLSAVGWVFVVISLYGAGFQLLRGLMFTPFAAWLRSPPWLRPLYQWLSPAPRDLNVWLSEALVVLLWAAVGLCVALILFNTLPTIRVSSRGLLIEFAGGWLPVAWQDLEEIHVTGDEAGLRFVLLMIPAKTAKRLTGWHRLYGLLYGTTIRPSFLITSTIADFDQLLNTILQENSRAIRAFEGHQPVVVNEQRRSPLFSLFLRGKSAETLPDVDLPPTTTPDVTTSLPAWSLVRLTTLGTACLTLIAGFVHYRSYWDRALTLLFPDLRSQSAFLWVSQIPIYNKIFSAYQGVSVPLLGIAGRPDLPAPIWLLIAAHLMLASVIIAIIALVVALPVAATAGQQALTIRFAPRPLPFTRSIPWSHISAFSVIDLGFGYTLVFVQSPRLPWLCHLCGLLVNGQWTAGTVFVGTMRQWPQFIEQCTERLSHLPPIDEKPRFRPSAFVPIVQLIGQPVTTIRTLRAELAIASNSSAKHLWVAGKTMALVALPVGLCFTVPTLLHGDWWPSSNALFGGIGFWMAGLLEWPLVGLIAMIMYGTSGTDQEQVFALYPRIQMPRLLPMLLALVSLLINIPWLAALFWLLALVIAYWVTAALWVEVYEREGVQAITGGLLPVVWQLIIMLGFWLLR
jgi:hypothetical protein